jgi:hypothetical protein
MLNNYNLKLNQELSKLRAETPESIKAEEILNNSNSIEELNKLLKELPENEFEPVAEQIIKKLREESLD